MAHTPPGGFGDTFPEPVLDDRGHMIWTRPDGGGMVVTLERVGDGAGTPPNPFRLPGRDD